MQAQGCKGRVHGNSQGDMIKQWKGCLSQDRNPDNTSSVPHIHVSQSIYITFPGSIRPQLKDNTGSISSVVKNSWSSSLGKPMLSRSTKGPI
jgi:hypothetical protein